MALGMGELIVILFLLFGVIAVIFAVFYFLTRYLTIIGGKTCPRCAKKINGAAKVCRHCHLDVTDV